MPITEQAARHKAAEMLSRAEGASPIPARMGQKDTATASAFALTGILAALVNIERHLQQISVGLGLILENK